MVETSQVIKFKQITEILLKWHWIIIIPFCISMLAGSWLVVKLPRIYEARTVILVQPQKVPSNIVRNIVSSDINTRISTLSQRILSRTNLEEIIKDFKLYSAIEYEKVFIENKVEMLEKRISVKVTRGGNRNADSFSINFRGKDPEKVMNITNSLASSFINENLKIRETQVLGTNIFLEDELATMRKKLIEHEKALKDYREKYMGGLPEQLNSNLRILDNLNDQSTDVRAALRNAKERFIALQERSKSDLANENRRDENNAQPLNIEQLRAELESYLNRYTEWHPDVISLKKKIADAEEQLNKNKETKNVSGLNRSSNRLNSDAELNRERNVIKSEIKRLSLEQNEVLRQIALYKKRVEDTPNREQELMSLQRDYNNINVTYNSLLGRQLEAQIAVNMEKKQKGEQFRVLDPARLPQSPLSPDKKKLFIFVMAAGLGIGAVIIFCLEYMDSSFREPEELEAFLNIPVIATMPTILNTKNSKWIKAKLVGSIAGIVFSITLFVVFVYLLVMTGGEFG